DRVGAAEPDVRLAAVDEVLHLDLHESAALARLGVLDLRDLPDAAFIFQDVTRADIHATDFHGVQLSKIIVVASARPSERTGRGQGNAAEPARNWHHGCGHASGSRQGSRN